MTSGAEPGTLVAIRPTLTPTAESWFVLGYDQSTARPCEMITVTASAVGVVVSRYDSTTAVVMFKVGFCLVLDKDLQEVTDA